MFRFKAILLAIPFFFCVSCARKDILFPIHVNGLIGYIDSQGKVCITPKFHNAGDFIEGLAYARGDSGYGYINTKGDFVILQIYDLASDFHEGIAKVYLNGKPFFIDSHGKKLFDADYKEMSPFTNGLSRIKTYTNKMGVINKSGKFILDTVYEHVGTFNEGLAPVDSFEINYLKLGPSAVIDTNDNFIVPYRKYSTIQDYVEGFAYFEIAKKIDGFPFSDSLYGFIDKKGAILSITAPKNSYTEGGLVNGYIRVHFIKTWMHFDDEMKKYDDTSSYVVFMDPWGHILAKDTNITELSNISFNRAFAKKKLHYVLVNKNMVAVSKNTFKKYYGWSPEYFLGDKTDEGPTKIFTHGLAFVLNDSDWGAIDTTGIYIIPPMFFHLDDVDSSGHYFIFQDRNNKYGIADFKGNILVKAILDRYIQYHAGYKNKRGLFEVYQNNRDIYIDSTGKIVSSYPLPNKDSIVIYNTDLKKIEGYSTYHLPKDEEYGIPIKSIGSFLPDTISIVLDTGKKTTITPPYKATKYLAFTAYIGNTSDYDIDLPLHEGGLYMRVQALDRNNQWKDIEERSCSEQGQRNALLKSKCYWQMKVPIYEGGFVTKMRLALDYKLPNKTIATIYSKTYKGSINPAQFWNKDEVLCW